MRLACLSVFLYLRAEPTALRLSGAQAARLRFACGRGRCVGTRPSSVAVVSQKRKISAFHIRCLLATYVASAGETPASPPLPVSATLSPFNFQFSPFTLLRYHRPNRIICRAGGGLRAAAREDMRLVGIAYRTVRCQVTRCYPAEQLIVRSVASRLALAVVGQ